MTARPLPPHGTYARANGSPGRRPPCPCAPCREEKLRTRKRLNVARELGRAARVDATAAREHLAQLHARMSWIQLEEATGCDSRNLQLIWRGDRKEINRTTETKILAARLAEEPAPGVYLDANGSVRRLQALAAIGYSGRVIALQIGTTEARIHKIMGGKQRFVRHKVASRINALYVELSSKPAPPGRSRTRVIKHAADNGYAPPTAWDPDTIDDPDAIPEWTGHCGTDRGWWIHRTERIPACPPCLAAHERWRQERAGLKPADWYRALGQARAESSNREAALAEDGRELMRLGATYETAAARLGVTRQHLQQVLRRHPEQTAA
ncbi:hypothetical protein ABGT92_23615 [Streptomyces cinereoruber]|uniref:hypothetical protein n=1 Tax=Streptomyces cinereoruber TaxID=67260 RepID=UPI00345D2FBA